MQNFDTFLKDLKRAVIVRSYSELGRPYEVAIMPAVKKLKAELSKQYDEQEKLARKREQAVLDGGSQELLEHFDECSGDAVDNQIFLEQQMAVIAEMRLVYLYKSYEVDLKRILAGAYPDDLKNLHYWNEQSAFLLSKGIKLKKITGHMETDELRIIVNNIKHGTELDNKAKAIPEFANSEAVTYQTGTGFYKRVEPLVNKYIEEVSQQVFNSLT